MDKPTVQERFGRTFLLLLVLAISLLFFMMIRRFAMDLLLAAIFAGLSHPLYRRLTTLFRGREAAASLATIVIVLLVVIVPLTGFLGIVALATVVYYGMGWIKVVMPESAFLIVSIGVSVAYLLLLWVASKRPDLEIDDPNDPVVELPVAGDVARTGYYFILPIVILIWCIVVERLSPALSAFWATIAMIIVALTQHPIKAIMRGNGYTLGHAIRRGI